MKTEHIVKSYDKDLENLRNLTVKILDINYNQLDLFYSMIANKTPEIAKDIFNNDEKINLLDLELIQLSLNILSLRNPLAYDLRLVFTASHISKNAERIGDYTKNAAKKFAEIETNDNEVEAKILTMTHIIMAMMKNTIEEIKDANIDDVYSIIDRDLEIDELCDYLSEYIINTMITNNKATLCYNNYLNILRFLERIGDHIVNICTNISYIKKGTFIRY